MSRFQSPVYPTHQQRDRAVADQVRPSAPITCDDCARPWQPGDDAVLRETGQQCGFNHISASQRRKHEARIQSEKAEAKPMGKMSEQARKNISEGIRKARAAKAAALAAGQANSEAATVTVAQEVAGKPETRTTSKTMVPVHQTKPADPAWLKTAAEKLSVYVHNRVVTDGGDFDEDDAAEIIREAMAGQ